MKSVCCNDEGLAVAAKILNSGGVVVIPTDTVYGLAARPDFPAAVERLYTIKGREAKKPIAMLAADAESTGVTSELVKYWPGGLTIVANGEGYRVPDHDWTRRLIKACGGLLRVTSANLSGQRPATDAEAALGDVGLSADLVVDDGVSPGGVPSTVVRLNDHGGFDMLRKGAITLASLFLSFALFAMREVTDWCDGWEFSRDEQVWNAVEVPHDWAIAGPFDKQLSPDTAYLPWSGVGYYRKAIVLDRVPTGRRVFLDFDGIMCDGTVFVNGFPCGHEAYGYLGLRSDITPYLEPGTNTVVVRADTTKLKSRWYPGAGMYRKVRKIEVDDLRLDDEALFVTTPEVSSAGAVLSVKGAVVNDRFAAEKVRLVASVFDRAGNLVARGRTVADVSAGEKAAFEFTLPVDKPELWEMVPDAALYTVRVMLEANGVTDEIAVRTGFRSYRLDAENGFILNGRRVQLRGVDLHSDLGVLGLAFNRSAMRRQLSIMREMGANALRTSHNPPSPEVLELCDEMGFFVWDECFDKWNETSGRKDERLEDYVESHLRKFVRRDRNHPSVMVWSMGNEIPSAAALAPGKAMWNMRAQVCTTRERCTRFYRAMKEVDPTRPVGIGCCFTEAAANGDFADLDFTGWNYRETYMPMRKAYPDKPLVYSESASAFSVYGYYAPSLPTNRNDFAWDDNSIDSYDRNCGYWSDIADIEFERMERDTFVAGEFVWTGIDYLGEPSPYASRQARSSYFGICDLLAFPKDRYYLYRSYWNPSAFTLHIVPAHWNFEGRKELPVYVYSSAAEVELFLNGKSLGRRRKDPGATSATNYFDILSRYRFIWKSVPYERGELKAVAYDKDGKALGTEVVLTAGEAAKVVLRPESDTLPLDRGELVFVEVRLQDGKGVPVPGDCRRIDFAAEGALEIVAVGNGDPRGLDSFKDVSGHPLHLGRAGVVVRRNGPGAAVLKASAEGLVPAEVSFR